MDVLLTSLTKEEQEHPLWLKLVAYVNERIAVNTRRLVNKNDEEIRGRIKELELLVTPPAHEHTAN